MKDFLLSEDHLMIQDVLRSWLFDWYDEGQVLGRHAQSGDQIDMNLWTKFAAEQGFAGVGVDAAYGGAGLGALGLAVAAEELGYALCPIPFLATCAVTAQLLSALGTDEAKSEYLPMISTGEKVMTYFDGHDALTVEDGKLCGVVDMVLDAAYAQQFLFSLRHGETIALHVVNKELDTLLVTGHSTLDPTRNFAKLSFDGVALEDCPLIGKCSLSALKNAQALSFRFLAAESLGGAQRCLDLVMSYAEQRVQFGRPIASFQAYKHKCADLYIALEAARSAVYAAASADEKTDFENAVELSLIAKATANDVFFKIAGDAIQLHGGIGFTWEYPLHYYFKRARANRSMFGSADQSWADLADHLYGDVG